MQLVGPDALDHVAGYLIVNDVSIPHEVFYRPSIRFKARDGFCPLGPAVVTRDRIADPDALGVRTFVDGALVQDSNTADLVRLTSRLLADVTEFMTLSPGDVLAVGTARPCPRVRAGSGSTSRSTGWARCPTGSWRKHEARARCILGSGPQRHSARRRSAAARGRTAGVRSRRGVAAAARGGNRHCPGHHSADLEIELARRRIPFVKYGGLRYLEAAHVKDLLAAFRLADNPRDEMAWFRLLQLMPGVGPSKARRAIDALRDVDGVVPLSHGEIQSRWSHVLDVLPEDARAMSSDLALALCGKATEPVAMHAERICRAVEPLITSSYDDAAPRLEDLGALVLACHETTRLSDVAAEQALEPPASTGDLAGPPMMDEDWLVLSTVHSAKGLEFDAVHVIHAADGNFPSDMALGSPEGLEEERRLFYVAITRARRNLSIYVPLRYHHHRVRDDHSWAQPSRFLSAAVRSTLVEETGSKSQQDPPSSPVTIKASELVTGHLSSLW